LDEYRYELLANIASLYYEEGLNQQAIANRLGYSRAHVSRLLSEAIRQGIVEIHIHHPLERVAALERRMVEVFSLQEVRVLRGAGSTYQQNLRRLGGLSTGLLVQKITPNSILGISWGTALYEVANALGQMDLPDVKVVQLIGSATTRDHQVDGPGLARAFTQRFGGQYFTLAAPWLVADRQVRDALMVERRMLEVLDLARRADIALVGIGSIEPTLSSLVRAGYLTIDEVRDLQSLGAVGDVCGHHFDLDGNLMDIPVAGYAIGIEADVLRRIPVVIGVAGGIVKAPAILGAFRAGLVNCLVTDDNAAREVLELAGTGEYATAALQEKNLAPGDWGN
jgi:DNA-binding transcriptional regulator LsrR (DeoR family)